MTAQPFRRDRSVIPRWRPIARVLASGELSMPRRLLTTNATYSPEFVERLEAWRLNKNVITGAELVEIAIVEGVDAEGESAARTLISEESTATPLVKNQAALLLKRLGKADDVVALGAVKIGPVRRHLRQFPEDALSWVDLALGFVTIGRKEAAQRAMAVALQLSPHNRHVLRSAARMYLHYDDPERAHDILRNNAATKHDPWLVAGEIALSKRANRKPFFFKAANAILESDDFQPLHLSELASAVGTVHLLDGNRKARKLFRKSLLDPTGNALAQAEWANPHLGGEMVSSQLIERVQDSGEARAFHAYWQGDFQKVIETCAAWVEEEPFSSRPHIVGSLAAITSGNLELALRFSKEGLAVDPDSVILQNHLAYALIDGGQYEEAAQVLLQTSAKSPDKYSVAFLLATAGMLDIRLGKLESGIEKYKSAMLHFRRLENYSAEASAAAFLAYEVARANSEKADEYIAQAEKLSKDLRYAPEAKVLLTRAKNWKAAMLHRQNFNR